MAADRTPAADSTPAADPALTAIPAPDHDAGPGSVGPGAAARQDGDAAGHPPSGPGSPHRRRWWGLVLLCGTSFMVVLDTTTVLTALPAMQADLGFSDADLQWVVTTYTLTFGGLMLLGGRLADVGRRRNVFVASVAAFLAASVLCGLAWSAGVLVAARAVQGVGAAVVVPSALSLLMATFPEGPDRNRAFAAWNATAGIGGAAGFLVGGPLTDGPGWPWIFLINVPMGLAAVVAAPAVLPAGTRPARRRLDLPGAVTVTAGLVLAVYGIYRVPDVGWASTPTVLSGGAAAVLLVVFVRIESRTTHPLVPLRLFRSPMLLGGNIVLVLAGVASSFTFVLTLLAQQRLGYSAREFAFAMLVPTAAAVAGSLVAERLVTRFGVRATAVGGLTTMGAGLVLLAVGPADGRSLLGLVAAVCVVNVGFGAVGVAASLAALTGVADDEAGVASGIEESTWVIGGPLGVAVLATTAATRTDGLLADGVGRAAAEVGGYEAAFLAAAAAALVAIPLAHRLLRGPASGAANRAAGESA